MVKKHAHFLVLMILLAALPATSQGQDLNTVINNLTKAMGAANLKTIRYSGSGSSYTAGKDVTWIKSYSRDIDISVPSSRIQIVRDQGTPQSQNIGANTPWTNQYRLWTNPLVFVRAAATHNATVSSQTVFAQKYTVVTFALQNKYKVSGFINEQNFIEKIQTWIDPNETLVEATYRDYQDFSGLKFPTMIIEKQAGELSMILIVDDVKPNAGMNGFVAECYLEAGIFHRPSWPGGAIFRPNIIHTIRRLPDFRDVRI